MKQKYYFLYVILASIFLIYLSWNSLVSLRFNMIWFMSWTLIMSYSFWKYASLEDRDTEERRVSHILKKGGKKNGK